MGGFWGERGVDQSLEDTDTQLVTWPNYIASFVDWVHLSGSKPRMNFFQPRVKTNFRANFVDFGPVKRINPAPKKNFSQTKPRSDTKVSIHTM